MYFRKKIKYLFFLVFLLPTSVNASDISEVGKYDLELFGCRMVESSFFTKVLSFGMSENFLEICAGLINFFFGISKVFWQGIDFLLEKMLEFNVFEKVFDVFFGFGQKLFLNLYNQYGLVLILISVGFWTVKFLSGRREEAKKGAFRFFGAIALAMMIFGFGGVSSNGKNVAKDIDSLLSKIESSAFLVSGEMEEFSGLQDEETLSDKVRNMYFEKAVVEPYLLMNYGTTNIKKLEEIGIDPTEFLAKKLTKKSVNEISDKINKAYKEFEKTETKGETKGTKAEYYVYLGQDKIIYKAMVAFFSPLVTLSIGVPLLFVCVGKIVTGLAMGLSIILITFSALLSFFPACEGALFGSVKKFLDFAVQKSLISIIFLIIYYVNGFIDTMIVPSTVALFVINAIVKIIVFGVIFAKRKVIFEKMKMSGVNQTMERSKEVRQKISQAPSQVKGQLQQKQRQVQNMALKGAEVAGNVYRPLKHGVQAVKMARTVQEKRQAKKEGQVINPLELEGRTPQRIGYGGRKVIYGGMDKNSPMNGGSASGNDLSIVPFLPVDRLFFSSLGKNNKSQLGVAKPSFKHTGQRIPLNGNQLIPRVVANGQLSQQVGQLRQTRLLAKRLSGNTVGRTSQLAPVNSLNPAMDSVGKMKNMPNGMKQVASNIIEPKKEGRLESRSIHSARVQQNTPRTEIEQPIILEESVGMTNQQAGYSGSKERIQNTKQQNSVNKKQASTPTREHKKSVPPLPNGRTPQRRI